MVSGFIKDHRFWQPYNLITAASHSARNASNNGVEIIGVILASTPLSSPGIKPGFVILASCIMGLAAIFSIVALSTQLSAQPDGPILALIERVKKWRSDKHLPPGKKFSGAWAELSELIDQTLIEWQSTIQGLKGQVNKAASQVTDDKFQSESKTENKIDNEQFDVLNKQLSNQNRQLSEFSRQLNHANQQAVFLQHELDTILQSTTEGILILDQYGNIIHANNTFLHWLGMTEGEVAGRFCLELIKNPTAMALIQCKTQINVHLLNMKPQTQHW